MKGWFGLVSLNNENKIDNYQDYLVSKCLKVYELLNDIKIYLQQRESHNIYFHSDYVNAISGRLCVMGALIAYVLLHVSRRFYCHYRLVIRNGEIILRCQPCKNGKTRIIYKMLRI